MAHQITQNDGLVLAGQRAWHGLGTVLPERCDVYTAMRVAKMNWEVEAAPLTVFPTDGEAISCADYKCIVRKDTREVFAPCGADYTPIQNADIARLAYEISSASEQAVESAGSIRGGRRVWFLLDMGVIHAAHDDQIKPYLFLGAGHDMTMALTIGSIATRVVCANTYAVALREMGSGALKIRHSMSADARIAQVKDWLEAPKKAIKNYGEQVIRMAETGITEEQLQAFFFGVWQRANGALTEADIKEETRRSTRFKKEVATWLANFRSDERQTAQSTSGTVWAALNSITQFANHNKTVRNEAQDPSRRQESVLFGNGHALNKAAHEAAVALIG